MNKVISGQVWSLMDVGKHRYLFTIDRIEGRRAFGHIGNGRPERVDLTVLTRGRRSARLERHPDGTVAERAPRYKGKTPPTLEDTATASDYIRTSEPRGIAKASDRQRQALIMREVDDRSISDIAIHFGVTKSIVNGWLSKAREAREEERNLRRTG